MKKLLLILLTLPFLGIAQKGDWHPLPSDQVSYFGQYHETGDIEYSKIQPIQLDSVNGNYYYNTRTPEKIPMSRAYYDPYSSWMGKMIEILDGVAKFENVKGQIINVHFQEAINTPWLFFEDTDGSYIQAHISLISEMEILDGLTDSVKHISFQTYDSQGLEIDDPVNDKTIQLSKNYGWVSVFRMSLFSRNYYAEVFSLMGMELPNINYGFEWDYNSFITEYEIGDEFHIYSDEDHDRKIQIDDKLLIDNCINYYCTICEEDYDGTTSTDHRSYTYLKNTLPGQTIFETENISHFGYYEFSLYRDLWQGRKEYLLRRFIDFEETELNGEYQWHREGDGGNNYDPAHYKSNNVWTFYQAAHGDRQYSIEYFNTEHEEWGEAFDFYCENPNEADWFPIPSDQVSYFRLHSRQYNTDYQLLPMRIDSIGSSFSGDIYYNVRTPIKIDQDEDYVYYDPFTSWLGYAAFIDMGKANFSVDTNNFTVFYINPDDSPWVFHTYEDESYVEAHFPSKDYIEIVDDLSDSVKYMCFQSFDSNGIEIDGEFDNDTLILSKNYGFVRAYNFTSLPNSRLYVNLKGIEKHNEDYGFEWNYDELVSGYEIDDVIQMQFDETYQKKDLYINKSVSGDFAEYTILRCNSLSAELDTIVRKFPLNLLPGQTYFGDNINGMGFSTYTPTSSEFLGSNQYSVKEYHDFFETEWNGETAWAMEPYISMSDYPTQLCNEYHYFCTCSNADGDSYEITYLKTSTEEWGVPISFPCNTSINEIVSSSLSAAPNPSNGIFNITNNSSKKIEEITIYNTNGKIVWQQDAQENKQQIDVSFLSTGLYLMKAHLVDGEVINRKLIIQK